LVCVKLVSGVNAKKRVPETDSEMAI